MEEGGNRWSKPHVATLSLHSLFELRSLLLNGTVMLDMEASSLEQIADLVLDNMIGKGVLPMEAREKVRTFRARVDVTELFSALELASKIFRNSPLK